MTSVRFEHLADAAERLAEGAAHRLGYFADEVLLDRHRVVEHIVLNDHLGLDLLRDNGSAADAELVGLDCDCAILQLR